jgi:predicted ABC-class ATPase
MARILYELYVLFYPGNRKIFETDDSKQLLQKLQRMIDNLEQLCKELPETKEMLDIRGFRIDLTIMEEDD